MQEELVHKIAEMILYCIVLYYIKLYYISFYHIILYYISFYYYIVSYCTLSYITNVKSILFALLCFAGALTPGSKSMGGIHREQAAGLHVTRHANI